MKLSTCATPTFLAIALLATGCSQEKPKPQASSVLDVQEGPAPEPMPEAPVAPRPSSRRVGAAKPPAASSSSADISISGPASTAAGQTYVVQKGDTLFKIAKTYYGDGTKWKKIADANPNVNATTLKVGQTLVIPN